MTWIKTLTADEVSGPLRQMYEADLARLGFVMAATRALSLRPDVAQAFDAFTAAVKAASALSPQQRRLISLVVADRLGSTYCVLVYAVDVERDLGGLERVRAVLRDYRDAGLGTREVAILDYAVAAATGHPTERHVARLREQGVDDGTILDIAVWATLRALRSRLYDALGVQTDPFFLEQEDLVAAITAAGNREVTR
jgi:uncharacterized peroxidase-related enzyme